MDTLAEDNDYDLQEDKNKEQNATFVLLFRVIVEFLLIHVIFMLGIIYPFS